MAISNVNKLGFPERRYSVPKKMEEWIWFADKVVGHSHVGSTP
jgi:hypothetical protein